MQVLMDWPEILTLERTWNFPFLFIDVVVVAVVTAVAVVDDDMAKISSLFGWSNFWSKEMGELVPDPEWLEPDSMPELESCLLLNKSSSSNFDFEYLKHSRFNWSDLERQARS